MVAWRKPEYVTHEEYMEGETRAEYRSEYFGGVVVAMAGAEPPHVRIAGGAYLSLGVQLRKTPCEAFGSDMAVRVPECDRTFYPDVSVACEAKFLRHHGMGVLLNPVVVVEVLSKSTARLDRGEKMECYRTLESLLVYVLIEQESPRAEVFTRQPDGSWRHDIAKGLDAVIELPAVGCPLPLSEIYARVEFPPLPPPGPEPPPED